MVHAYTTEAMVPRERGAVMSAVERIDAIATQLELANENISANLSRLVGSVSLRGTANGSEGPTPVRSEAELLSDAIERLAVACQRTAEFDQSLMRL